MILFAKWQRNIWYFFAVFALFSCQFNLEEKLMEAIQNNDLYAAQKWINRGAIIDSTVYTEKPINDWPKSALSFAVRNNQWSMTKLLLQNGANINLKDHSLTSISFLGGQTPLHHAKTSEMLDFLLKNGANPNISDSFGESPLFRVPTLEYAQLLVKAGATINSKSILGYYPLHIHQQFEIIDFLIRHGGDLNKISHTGFSPIEQYIHNEQILLAKQVIQKHKSKLTTTTIKNIKDRSQNIPSILKLFSKPKKKRSVKIKTSSSQITVKVKQNTIEQCPSCSGRGWSQYCAACNGSSYPCSGISCSNGKITCFYCAGNGFKIIKN
jgi:hypothetical protein